MTDENGNTPEEAARRRAAEGRILDWALIAMGIVCCGLIILELFKGLHY